MKKSFKIYTRQIGFQIFLENITEVKSSLSFLLPSIQSYQKKKTQQTTITFVSSAFLCVQISPYCCYSHKEKLILKSTVSLPVVVFHPLTASANFYIFLIHQKNTPKREEAEYYYYGKCFQDTNTPKTCAQLL